MEKIFYTSIQNNPIIAAIHDIDNLDSAINTDCEIIFLLTGNIFNLRDVVEKIKLKDKEVYIHVDLLEGFSRDLIALKYIHENIRPSGIITTKLNLVKIAKEMDLFTIQRLFILDSQALETGIKSIHMAKPNAVEILPGIMPKIIKKVYNETNIPVIAGGLIQDKEDVIESLKAGAIGISSSCKDIWNL
ncbi:MAG: glycerol-3-phosphate responsive antiterminator [Clostridiales bacterium]|nr:glycerol-3-phosphate responsive antiterminator [Clostridiales bacterium]